MVAESAGADVAELAVQVAVGLGSGVVGAVAGARMQRRLRREEQEEERRVALWALERAFRFTGERLMDARSGKAGSVLQEAERQAARYYHTLPDELRKAVEADPHYPPKDALFEVGDELYATSLKLRRHLEQEAPRRRWVWRRRRRAGPDEAGRVP